MEVFTFECEWDIGINENIYATEEVLRRDVAQALKACGIDESLEECEEEGYISIDSNSVVR